MFFVVCRQWFGIGRHACLNWGMNEFRKLVKKHSIVISRDGKEHIGDVKGEWVVTE